MRIVFSDSELATSKAEWEPNLRSYADATNAILCNARRLPIYEKVLSYAAAWLRDLIHDPPFLPKHHTLIIAGDEHVHAATDDVSLPSSSVFLYRSAWTHWCSCEFYGKVPWWCEASWTINFPQRVIELVDPNIHELQLTPNQTFLCSDELEGRGRHWILSVDDLDNLIEELLTEWLVT